MKAIRLRTEYLKNPIGIDVREPQLFWNCEGGKRQTAYEIEACDFYGKILWKTGKVMSSRMSAVYEKPLHSRDIVNWKVRLWDEEDSCGEWSETAHFEMGLLSQTDWKAKWIRGDYKVDRSKRYPVDCFRKVISLGEVADNSVGSGTSGLRVTKARAYITACGLYRLYINGIDCNTMEMAPGHTDYKKRIQYQTIDVTSALREGENTIELELADGWFRGGCGAHGIRNQYGMETKVLLQLEIEKEDGSVDTVITDKTWEWSNDGSIRMADNKDGEIVDVRMQACYQGHAVETTAKGSLCASNNVEIHNEERFEPQLIITPKGKTVWDFGQNMAGGIEFSLTAKAGTKILLRFGEILGDDGEFTQKNIQIIHKSTGPTPLQQIEYICKEGENHYSNKFSIFGFQYVQAEAWDEAGREITIEMPSASSKEQLSTEAELIFKKVEAIARYSDLEQTGFFHCSNELINRFVHCTLWSAKGNSADVPTDCPTRERHGWTGDAQIFYQTAGYLFNYAPFARKYIKDMTDWQKKNGRMPHIVPEGGADFFMYTMNGASGWSDASVFIPYRQWKLYGDERIIRDNYEAMKAFTEFVIRRLGRVTPLSDALHMKSEDRRWVANCGQSYGEWAEPIQFGGFVWTDFVKPHPEVSTAYSFWQLQLMEEIAEHLGREEDAKRFKEIAKNVRRSYQALRKTKNYPLETVKQAELVRPLYLGLFDEEQTTEAKNFLLRDLEEFDWRIGTGFLSTPLYLYVLEQMDIEYAYRLLENEKTPGWLAMPKAGATTVWESWEAADHGTAVDSRNHYSKGAMCQWLFESMCGISITGENCFRIAPKPGGHVSHASFTYQSVYGEVSSAWKKTESGVEYSIKIPANCEAKLELPGQEKQSLEAGNYFFQV